MKLKNMKYCEHTLDDGTYCGLKAVQIVISWISQKVYPVCRKHEMNKTKDCIEVIDLK